MHKLNIIDEQGGIIGEETREKIHTEGLLHQEIHVWLYTPNDEILFQHRGPDQETYPNLLDATIGGHVEIGDSVNATAIKEAEEEAGLKIKPEELIPLGQIRKKTYDTVTQRTNNVLRTIYAYRYAGKATDLTIGEGVGFEAWPIDQLLNLNEEEKKRFIPFLVGPESLKLFQKIRQLIEKSKR